MSMTTGRKTGLCAFVAWVVYGCGAPHSGRTEESPLDQIAETEETEPVAPRSDLDALDREAWLIGEGGESKFAVAWRSLEGDVERNRELGLELLVFRDGMLLDGATVGVRGRMPEHRHGFVQRPLVQSDGTSRHVAEGILFHMRGFWQFYVDVSIDGERDVVLFELHL